jgi:hypothetical protein
MPTIAALLRCGSIVSLLALSTACADSSVPTAPTATFGSSVPAAGPIGFPPVSGTARVYLATASPSFSLLDGSSRYVLNDDGTFVLQYAHLTNGGYGGFYEVANDGNVTFRWHGWSRAGPWGSTGTLTGNTLTVRYNLIMGLTDFEDGVYVRVR